jgi:ubiquinone/menaquinone biosynthesis C-methylase UbiE
MTSTTTQPAADLASERWTGDRIRSFWTEQAVEHGVEAAASWTDIRVMELELRTILGYLQDGQSVLDVGCANGFSTLQFARQKRVAITGVDYIPEMISHANVALKSQADHLAGTVSFDVGDATSLKFADNQFDTLVVIRVIINLGEWERQLVGLRECVRVLKPGGTLLLSEATVQGWARLNDLRGEWGMSPIKMPEFNNYLDQDRVADALRPTCDLVEINNFASSYYVGTRVLKPLIGKVAGCEAEVANPLSELNRWLSLLPAAGDYGTQKLFVFRKRLGQMA